MNFDNVQGSYKSISQVTFWVTEGWQIVDIPSEAMLSVDGQPAEYTIVDYMEEGDKRAFILKMPQVEQGSTVKVALKPAFIKVCHKDDTENVINLNEIPTASNKSTGTTTVPYYINDIDQFEAKTRITNRSSYNVSFIGGRYTMKYFAFLDATAGNIQKDIVAYTPDDAAEGTGKLLKKKEDGTFEEIATGAFSFDGLDFSLDFDNIYSDPGEYYLQYPTSGSIRCMYLNSSGVLTNQSRHISNILTGPITVTEQTPDNGVLRLSWLCRASTLSD
ncbi:MAG: hypothetical protein K2K72_06225, partial [Duncaniella sp.]|nr:hypothetical protein [Duncaniella sp.]